jgi:hypothetical protein
LVDRVTSSQAASTSLRHKNALVAANQPTTHASATSDDDVSGLERRDLGLIAVLGDTEGGVAAMVPEKAAGRTEVARREADGRVLPRPPEEPRTVFRLHRYRRDWPFVIVTTAFVAAASLLLWFAR